MSVFCSLYSSSSGNCTYIGTDAGGILIDIGVSAKRAEEALISIGVDPSSIAAVFVTHEHSDHIGGVRVFAHRHSVKVFASQGTLEGMDEAGVFRSSVDAYIMPDSGTEAAGIYVRSFRTSHDSYESTGFTAVTPDGRKLAVATLDEAGKVLDLAEKPQEPKSTTAIYATYFYLKETLPRIREYLDEGNTPDAPGNFPSWLYTRQDVYAYRAHGNCIDIGTPENYQEVCDNYQEILGVKD